jgi:type I restriction enzyme S subunit
VTERAAPLRRFKPYPNYKDSGVEWLGEIPAHWEVKRLRHLVARIEQGWSPDCENREADEDEWGVLKAGCVNRGAFLESENKALPATLLPVVSLEIAEGDLLMSRASGSRDLVGSVAVVPQCRPRLILCDKVFRLHPYADRADRHFLAYAMNSRGARSQIEVVLSGGSGLANNIAQEVVKDLVFAQPRLPEQRAIVIFLDRETTRIDALVAKKERLIELLQEQRTALIVRSVNAGFSPPAKEWQTSSEVFPSIPADWEARKLRRLIVQVKRPVAVDQNAEYREIGIRSWGRGIFHKDPIRGALLEEKSVFKIEPGDFVLNIVFAWEGAAAVATESERGMIGSHRFPTFRVSDEIDIDYLLMVLQTEQGRWLMEVNSPGAAGRNKTIRLGQFLDELIPLPPFPLQRELVRRFRTREQHLDALILKLREAIERLKELRTALISAAVTGEIDVRETVI